MDQPAAHAGGYITSFSPCQTVYWLRTLGSQATRQMPLYSMLAASSFADSPVNRNLLLFGLRFYRRAEFFGFLAQHHCCINVTHPPEVANRPMYPFKYSWSRHSISSVT